MPGVAGSGVGDDERRLVMATNARDRSMRALHYGTLALLVGTVACVVNGCVPALEAQERPVTDVSHLIEYTEAALEAGTEGVMLLQVVIATDGSAGVGRVLVGLPHGLTENAVAAIESETHRPVATRTVSAVAFSLPPDRPEGLVTMPSLRELPWTPPEPGRAVNSLPEYPRAALEAGVGGVVTLQGFIDERGRIEDVTVIKGLSHGLTESAIKTFRKLRFRPARLDGKPIPWPVYTPFTFRPPG